MTSKPLSKACGSETRSRCRLAITGTRTSLCPASPTQGFKPRSPTAKALALLAQKWRGFGSVWVRRAKRLLSQPASSLARSALGFLACHCDIARAVEAALQMRRRLARYGEALNLCLKLAGSSHWPWTLEWPFSGRVDVRAGSSQRLLSIQCGPSADGDCER